MGATLPLLVAHLVRRSGHVGGAVGLLYYVNTLGAGAACLSATVLLFPFIGMQGAVYVAVAMNGAVASGALAAHWRDRDAAEHVFETAPAVAAEPVLGFAAVLGLAAAGGFVSLSYEIFFFRTISYATGSSASAFAADAERVPRWNCFGSASSRRKLQDLARDDMIRRALPA